MVQCQLLPGYVFKLVEVINMQRQTEHGMDYFPGATSKPNASSPPEFTAEGVPFGGSLVHYCDQG